MFWRSMHSHISNCAPLFVDPFLYTYESEFLLALEKSKEGNLAEKCHLSSSNNDQIDNFCHPPEDFPPYVEQYSYSTIRCGLYISQRLR